MLCGESAARLLVMHVSVANSIVSEIFSTDLSPEELPPHQFLQSTRNITIERGWLRLRVHWGQNVKTWWEEGQGIYNPTDPDQ